jgi:predicted nucleotide-binding protein (sugar kinase/HSP70/actin superfamily)
VHALNTAEEIMAGYARHRPRVNARKVYAAAEPWIDKVHSAGEGWLILGEIMHAAEQGVNSFVVVQPFGCMPNHVFGRGLTRVIKEVHPHVHVLCLDFDPDTSMGNIENRLQMLIMNARELDRLSATAPSARYPRRSSPRAGAQPHARS